MANLQDFINRHNGNRFGVTGHQEDENDYGQCTAIDHAWQQEELGYPIEYGNAIDLLKNANVAQYDVIKNSPTNVPSPGDIMVWGQDHIIGTGQYGHTALFVSGDVNRFASFDQNWPGGSAPHIQEHSYEGVLGWLHPKVLDAAAPPPPPPAEPALSEPVPSEPPAPPVPVSTQTVEATTSPTPPSPDNALDNNDVSMTIKSVQEDNPIINEGQSQVKPGYKTTEFWSLIVACVTALGTGVTGHVTWGQALAAIIALVVTYITGRSAIKVNN